LDVYITFFRREGSKLTFHNGFSFGRDEAARKGDLFFTEGCPPSRIAGWLRKLPGADRIFCSCSLLVHLKTVLGILDDRWVLGGPLIAGLLARGAELPCTAVATSFEEYTGQDGLSCDFSYYFERFAHKQNARYVLYNCSIGKGCYWNQCRFCHYRYYDSAYQDGRSRTRPNVAGLLARLRCIEGCRWCSVHLCSPATPPGALRALLSTERKAGLRFRLFLRADPPVLKTVRQFDGGVCEGKYFSIGLESFSQSIVDRIGKGTSVRNVLELTRLIAERGGKVNLGIMDHYAFIDEQAVGESLESLEKLEQLARRFPRGRIGFYNNGITRWPVKEVLPDLSDFEVRELDNGFYKRYEIVVPEDSRQFAWNKTVSQAIVNSAVPLRGRKFVSLR